MCQISPPRASINSARYPRYPKVLQLFHSPPLSVLVHRIKVINTMDHYTGWFVYGDLSSSGGSLGGFFLDRSGLRLQSSTSEKDSICAAITFWLTFIFTVLDDSGGCLAIGVAPIH